MIKMPENSLFAVLLRSPWWISFAIAAAFVGLSKALLPDQYWLYGAFGGLTFVVIGFMALKKQWKLPGRQKVERTHQRVKDLSWTAFSAELERAFVRDGYRVKKLEGGADFAITRAGRTGVVSAKRWKAGQHSEESLRQLYAQKGELDAADCTLIALEPLGAKAAAFAEQKKIQLMRAAGLAQLLG
jgi:restriction system protein